MPIYDLDKLNEAMEPFELTIPSSILEDTFATNRVNTPMYATVIIYPKDGVNIPHFHVINKSIHFDACIQLFENKYFDHGPHASTISDGKTRKLLNKWLEMPCNSSKPLMKGYPIWSAMVRYWNLTRGTNYDWDIGDKPDYSHIYRYKE